MARGPHAQPEAPVGDDTPSPCESGDASPARDPADSSPQLAPSDVHPTLTCDSGVQHIPTHTSRASAFSHLSDLSKPSKTPSSLTEQSFMERVWERMELSKAGESSKSATGDRSSRSHSLAATMVNSSSNRPSRRCQVPFWLVVAVPIISSFLVACTAGFSLETRGQNRLRTTVDALFTESESRQKELNHELVDSNTRLHNSALLRNIFHEVKEYMVELPDRALDGLYTHMKTRFRFNQTLTGETETSRRELAYYMWDALTSDGGLNHSGGMIVAFQTGAVSCVQRMPLGGGRVSYQWYQAEPGVLSNAFHPGTERYTAGPGVLSNASSAIEFVALDEAGNPSGEPRDFVPDSSIFDLPLVRLQAEIAEQRPASSHVQAWSPIQSIVSGEALMAWTSPIAYCGNYSCFQGVAAHILSLSSLKLWCNSAWDTLASSLATHPYYNPITPNTSSVFVVQQTGRDPTQVGLLISAAGSFSSMLGDLQPATNSSEAMVRNTARALLQHFGRWDAEALLGESSPFGFRITGEDGTIQTLNNEDYGVHAVEEINEVATLSVELDDQTRWLVVQVLPVGALSPRALADTEAAVDLKEEEARAELNSTSLVMQYTNVIVFLVLVACSFVLGAALSAWVSRDLISLSKHMRQLSLLDFSTDSEEFQALMCGRRSAIYDVSELQEAFCCLAQSVRTFGRFVPESVVRNILRGNERALRLHVNRCEVTVMFSDIRDFTSISDKLSQADLLFVLTRYLSIMTNLVEHFGGVVTEILGDGVLAFWNTPEFVTNHATKACAAALAQQHALVSLNEELAQLKLPQLAIRIGLHTGKVLSGNLGSATKMKFGCMGDTVNLASRMEGLCKHYDLGILCSGETKDATQGIVCRPLNLVQVKGKNEPTLVCEVVGRDSVPQGEPKQTVAGPTVQRRVRMYEEALAAFHGANFFKCCTLAEQLLDEQPQDKATLKLLQTSWSYLCPDDAGGLGFTEETRATWTGVVRMETK